MLQLCVYYLASLTCYSSNFSRLWAGDYNVGDWTCKHLVAVMKDCIPSFICAACLVSRWSSFTVSTDALLLMACSSGVISSSSSTVTAWVEYDSKAEIVLWFGGCLEISSSSSVTWSSSKSTHELSHVKCSGVFPSTSWTSHAEGHAYARSWSNDAEALEPAATWSGVRCRQSFVASMSGQSWIIWATMSSGGLYLTTAWRSVMPLSWEHEETALATSRNKSGFDRTAESKIFQSPTTMSWSTSPIQLNMLFSFVSLKSSPQSNGGGVALDDLSIVCSYEDEDGAFSSSFWIVDNLRTGR